MAMILALRSSPSAEVTDSRYTWRRSAISLCVTPLTEFASVSGDLTIARGAMGLLGNGHNKNGGVVLKFAATELGHNVEQRVVQRFCRQLTAA